MVRFPSFCVSRGGNNNNNNTGIDRDNPQVEIFKSFRVSIEDPCKVVLPVVCLNVESPYRFS